MLLLKSRNERKHGRFSTVYPMVAKVGGLQSQGTEGEAVVMLLQTLGNKGSGTLRLSREGKKDSIP